jgi:uncharacterized protein (TIGR02001 family)
MNCIKLTSLAALALTAALPGRVHAQEPASSVAFNIGVFSDYRYRGISQTRLKPAVQGGVDWSGPGGFYLGAWASTIKWIKDAEGDAGYEIDVYGGLKGEINKDLSFDVGVLAYIYPGASTAKWDAIYKNPNTTEVYGALTFGPVTTKLSYAATNLFGNYDFAKLKSSKGSWYLDFSGSFDLGAGITMVPHLGYQKVQNIANASYTDYSLSFSKDFSGLVASAALAPRRVSTCPAWPPTAPSSSASPPWCLASSTTFETRRKS